jgi:simple sugar transport system ATP-binding protein
VARHHRAISLERGKVLTNTTYAIELKNICKNFGSVAANKNVSLNVKYGEILALLGENGSGKTTLMNMLSGIYHPDSGEIWIDGKHTVINSPKDSFKLKIGMIHQHFKLVDVFTAAENIIMGTEGFVGSSKKAAEKIKEIADGFGFSIDPNKKVYDMSVGEKQTVEIIKVLYRGARILILDEPTAVLTPQETEKLFKVLDNMRKDGCAIIIITHKLNEVMAISDRVTVLRKGETVATVDTKTTDIRKLTELMVGRPVELKIDRPETERSAEPMFFVKDLCVRNEEDVFALKNVSFELYGGEILGVAGVAGSGQRELCETIAGLMQAESGEITYKGENILHKSPAEIIDLGISMSFIPEDRLGMGLVASMDIADNMLLKSYKKSKGLVINRKPSRELAEKLVKRLEIVTPSIKTPVSRLSGGNVQKVLIGREIESNPNILITAYPVRGLDINSSFTIYNLLNEQKAKGVAVLYIGEDLDVILELCDRVMVLCHGEVMGIVDPRKVTKEDIGLMMLGNKLEKEGGAENE